MYAAVPKLGFANAGCAGMLGISWLHAYFTHPSINEVRVQNITHKLHMTSRVEQIWRRTCGWNQLPVARGEPVGCSEPVAACR